VTAAYEVYKAKTGPGYPRLSVWPACGQAELDAKERSGKEDGTFVVERGTERALTIMAEYRGGELRLDRPHRNGAAR
jgi:hypothetical protein